MSDDMTANFLDDTPIEQNQCSNEKKIGCEINKKCSLICKLG